MTVFIASWCIGSEQKVEITDLHWVSSRKQSWARFTQRRPVSIRVRNTLLQNWRVQLQPPHQMTRPSNNLQKAKSPVYDSNKSRPLGSDTRQQSGISGDQLGCWNSARKSMHVSKWLCLIPLHIYRRNLGTTKQSKNRIGNMFQTSENPLNQAYWN